MAILRGPFVEPTDPAAAIIVALATDGLEAEHVEVHLLNHEGEEGEEAWAWRLLPGSPPVEDREVVELPHVRQPGGRWVPAGPPRHPQISRGVALETADLGWVVAIHECEQEDAEFLVETASEYARLLLEGPGAWGQDAGPGKEDPDAR